MESQTESENNIQIKNISRDDFDFLNLIGKGGFSLVWKVKYKLTNEFFALKEMSKKRILDGNMKNNILKELRILSKLKHPFISNLHFAFQDLDYLYLVTDLFTGGDLQYNFEKQGKFSEKQVKFFIACVIQGLSYIHKNNIIHKDIKPQNLILDEKGYVHIIDFGISRENDRNNYLHTSGTYVYSAPEIFFKKHYSFSFDFYSIGVIMFLFMNKYYPYSGTKEQIKEQIEYKTPIHIHSPTGWDYQSINFTRRLLEINPEKRLGNENGIKELKEHPWFNKFPWEELKNKTLQAPYIPKENNNLKINIPVINNKTPTNISSISTNFDYQKFSGNENEFNDYYFNKNDKKEEKKKINSPKKQINKSKKNNLINLKILRESIKNKIEKYDEIEKENEINKKRITKNTKENKIRINYNYIQLYDNFKNK